MRCGCPQVAPLGPWLGNMSENRLDQSLNEPERLHDDPLSYKRDSNTDLPPHLKKRFERSSKCQSTLFRSITDCTSFVCIRRGPGYISILDSVWVNQAFCDLRRASGLLDAHRWSPRTAVLLRVIRVSGYVQDALPRSVYGRELPVLPVADSWMCVAVHNL